MAGRKAKPVALNKKNLTKAEIEKRTKAENLLKFNADAIEPPLWLLGDIALEEWYRVTKELTEKNLVTNVDISALAIGCDALEKYTGAKRNVEKRGLSYETFDKEGNVIIKQNPNVNIHIKYAKLYQSFCGEFGLTPSARIRLTLPTIEVKTEESPLAKLIRMKSGGA